MPDDIVSSGGERSLRGRGTSPVRLPPLVPRGRAGHRARIAGAVLLAVGVVAGIVTLKEATPPAPRPLPVHPVSIDLPYYPPPPSLVIPTPKPVPHTTLVGGTLPPTGKAPTERSAFAAMGAVLDHYCFRRGGGGAQSLKPLNGYLHVLGLANPPWQPEIDIELWWTGTSYRWQAQSGPLGACA